MPKYDYLVFDFGEGPTMGAVELNEKLDALGEQGYYFREMYCPHPNVHQKMIRIIMERVR